MAHRKLTETDIAECRIERRTTNFDGRTWHEGEHPFSEIFITLTDGSCYLTRVFYPLDDSGHARSAQIQDFLKRQNAPWPGE